MESFRQTELSQDERLSPVKFLGLRKSARTVHESHSDTQSEKAQFQPHSILQDTNSLRDNLSSEYMSSSRRNTISSTHALKTPSKVRKIVSMTSPRRNHQSYTVKGFVKNSSQNPNGRKFVELQRHLNSQVTLLEGKETSLTMADSYKQNTSAEVSRLKSSDDERINATVLNDLSVRPSVSIFEEDNLNPTGNDSHRRNSSGLGHEKESNCIVSLETRPKSSQLSQDNDDSQTQNSKPVYSLVHFEEFQRDYLLRIEELETVISEKNSELIELATRVTDTERRHVIQQETLIRNQNELNHLKVQEKALHFQLNQYMTDLNHSQELLDLKTKSLQATETSIIEIKENFENKIAQENRACSLSNQRLEETEMKLIDANSSMLSLEKEFTGMKATFIEVKEEKENLERKIESLMMEKDSTLASHLALQEEISTSKTKILNLESEVKEKDASLHSLTEKFASLTKEAEILHEDMLNFETEQKRMENDISAKSAKILELQAIERQLKELLFNQDSQLKNLNASERDLKAQIQAREEHLLKSRQKIIDLEAQNDEKDKIISGDTRKLTELVQQVTEQKNVISDQKAQLLNLDKGAELSTRESDELIIKLKRQISLAQEKTDQRIQEVAEQLYHQYSKKHEAKVTQLKLKYESKLEEKAEELERNERLVESLRSQLQTEMKEKTYLLGVLEKGDKVNTVSTSFHGEGSN